MTNQQTASYTAFSGAKRVASGNLAKVALRAKTVMDRDKWTQVVIFNDFTSQVVEVDFRGTSKDVLQRLAKREPAATTERPDAADVSRGPGRPRLGVVAREVTLLPRHWDWLASQAGGASVALRKLVEHARHSNQGLDARRKAQESAYRFLSAMAGNQPGFEEAIRALFADQSKRFNGIISDWPKDIRDHARKLAATVFAQEGTLGNEGGKKRSDPAV